MSAINDPDSRRKTADFSTAVAEQASNSTISFISSTLKNKSSNNILKDVDYDSPVRGLPPKTSNNQI